MDQEECFVEVWVCARMERVELKERFGVVIGLDC